VVLPPDFQLSLIVSTCTGIAGVIAGVIYSERPEHLRIAVPLSAGLLLGVALFGLLPELAQDLSWPLSVACFAAGFLVLTVFDRAGIPICPDCSHGHDHHSCAAPLHGFATPLLIAAGVHALFDGWALSASALDRGPGVHLGLPLALMLHKVPEGLALGGILKASMRRPKAAVALGSGVEALTLVGGVVSTHYASRLGSGWVNYPLAMAGGFFLFLAYHALHGEWRNGRRTALFPGAMGVAVAGLLQAGLRVFGGL